MNSLSLEKRLERIITGRTNFEISRQYSNLELAECLLRNEPINYRSNGNRAVPGEKFLKVLRPVMKRIGITRVGNISDLSGTEFPVYQSCRPNVFHHTDLGQNSGGQGKGYNGTQAVISSLMETIESYCTEPRNANLIRGSYNYLKRQHLILNPKLINRYPNVKIPKPSEPIMWTPAYSLLMDSEILVPAQSIYFPFLTSHYKTQSYFYSGSNGLASGATYLEAVVHGLYEVLERHYLGAAEAGLCEIEALDEEKFPDFKLDEVNEKMAGQYEIQLYNFRLKKIGKKNLPFILCVVTSLDRTFLGYGCCTEIEIAINRAVSETLQSVSVFISGSREDMYAGDKRPKKEQVSIWPEYQTLSFSAMKSKVINKRFNNLKDEFKFLVNWIKMLGHPEICIANLTRAGIEVPVVKILIPSLGTKKRNRGSENLEDELVTKMQFKF